MLVWVSPQAPPHGAKWQTQGMALFGFLAWEPRLSGRLRVGGLGAASCPPAWDLQMLRRLQVQRPFLCCAFGR